MRELQFCILSSIILFICTYGYSQKTSNPNQFGYWCVNETWVDENSPGLSISNDIIIQGTVSTNTNESLFFDNNSTLTISEEDTLVINGNLSAHVNVNFLVEQNGVLIILGNYTSHNNIEIESNGKFVVFGDFIQDNKNIDIILPSNENLYVFGDILVDDKANIDETQIGDQESFLSGEPELTEWLDENYNTQLPIELSSFTAFVTPRGIDFSWITKTENNNDFFTLEFSQNGIDFFPIATIPGIGNSTTRQSYSYFDDSKKHTGLLYFRLKQTDYNGTSSYSEILSISIPNYNTDVYIYPNPVSDYLYINDNTNTVKQVRFFDSHFTEIQIEHENGIFAVYDLPKGTYFVQIETETTRFLSKFLKK
ncbi:MAG: T9SS type A sorting domain-containing protein [Bacteroidota bacterium]